MQRFPTHVGRMAGGICTFYTAAETVRLRTVLLLYYGQGTAHHNKAPESLCCHATAQETSPRVGPVPVPWGLLYRPRVVLGSRVRVAGKYRESSNSEECKGPIAWRRVRVLTAITLALSIVSGAERNS
jgi:hypothetical protein